MSLAAACFAAMVLAGCASLLRPAQDRAFCDREPIDQVERQAWRQICS